MATFAPTNPPDFPLAEGYEPAVNVASFGDGYAQRTPAGTINNVRAELTLRWTNCPKAERDVIMAFMSARGGHESFDYQPPDFGASKKWVCPKWNSDKTDADNYTVEVTLQQVFDI